MFFRHSTDKLIYPLIAVAALFFVSYRPHYHLRKQMPSAFFQKQEGHERSLEERVAWAYWESAQMDVQFQYAYGHPLPMDPPPQFHVDAKVLGPAATDPATRKHYWELLQRIWSTPEAWEKSYEWDWSWVSDPVSSAAEWLRNVARETLLVH